jgi:Tfp pilus assembly protein PilN
MAQQINLFSPILLAPRRHFSAMAMLQALAVFCIVLAALCVWMVSSSASLRRDLQGSDATRVAERERLTKALAAPPAASGAALEQELVLAQQAVASRRALLEALSHGRLVEGRSHAAMLRMVAQTVPTSAWLTDIRLVEGRLELTGMTLQPEALRPWLVQLGQHPLTAEQRLAAMKIERVATSMPASGSNAPTPAVAPAWSFQLVSQTPALTVADVANAQGKP